MSSTLPAESGKKRPLPSSDPTPSSVFAAPPTTAHPSTDISTFAHAHVPLAMPMSNVGWQVPPPSLYHPSMHAGMGYQGPVYMGQSEWSPHHPSAAQAHSVMLQSQQHAVAGPATGYLHAVVNSGVLPPTMAAHLIRQASSGDPAAVAAAIATATPWVHAAQAAAAGSHTGGLVTAPAQSSALGPVVQQQQQPPYIRELHPPAQQQQMTTAPTSMVVAPPLGPVAPTAAASMPRPPEGLLLTAPLPPQSGVGPSSSLDHDELSYELAKKRAKREANKRSAQQCRQRKKQAMQALHDQNQEYKRHHEVLSTLSDMVFSFDVHNYPSPAAPPQADSTSAAAAAVARRTHAQDASSLQVNSSAAAESGRNNSSTRNGADDAVSFTVSNGKKEVASNDTGRKGEKRTVESCSSTSSSTSRSADVEASSERNEGSSSSQTSRHTRAASEYPIGYVSASVHTTLQYRDDELLGRSFLDLLSFDSRAQLGGLLNDKLTAHASVIGRRRARRLALAAEQVAEVAEAAHSAQRSLETLAPRDVRHHNNPTGRRPGSSSHLPFSPTRSAVSHAPVAASSSSAATSRAASTCTTGASDHASVTTAASEEVASLSSNAAAAGAGDSNNDSGGGSFVSSMHDTSSGCMSHSSSSSGLNGSGSSGSSGQTSNKASSEDLGSDPGSEGRPPSENFLCGPTSSVGSSDHASNSAKSSGSMEGSNRSAGSSNSGSEGSGSEGSGSGNSSPQRLSSGGPRSAAAGNGEVAGRIWAGAVEEPLVVDLCSHQRVQLRRRDGTVVTAHVNGVVSIAIDGSIEVVCSVRPCRDPMPSQQLGPHPSLIQLRQTPDEVSLSLRGPKATKSLEQARSGSIKPHASSSSSDVVAGNAPGGSSSALPGSGKGSSSMETDGAPGTSAAVSSAPLVSASTATAAAIAAAKAAAKATAKAAKYQALAEAAQATARGAAAAAEAAEAAREANTFSREGSVSPGSNPGSSLESGGHEGDVDSSDLTTTDPSDTDALSDSGFAADSAAVVTG